VAGIKLGAAINPGTDTGHTKIDITPSKVILVAMNENLAALLDDTSHTSNESIYNGYGLTGWDEHTWKDLSSIDAARKNFKIGYLNRDILQISEEMVDGTTHKVLKLGSRGGNTDSDVRPLSLATSITATKQNKTTQKEQTAQAAGLTGHWTYPCRITKGHPYFSQLETLDFEGDKLKTAITFYLERCLPYHKLYNVAMEADIVVGKSNDNFTQIGITTTKVETRTNGQYASNFAAYFNKANFYNTPVADYDTPVAELYFGYGQTDWQKDKWKDLSTVPEAIEDLNIGTQVPDIFKISTATDGSKELKMGGYKGLFDINGRAMSLEDKAAVLQPK
jgi:hypothetical protein